MRCIRVRTYWLLTERFADIGHGLENPVREVDLNLHVLHVGQLEAQQLVLWCEEEPSVCLDAVLVQRPVGFQQPCLLLLPPQGVVRPVLLHVWEGGGNNERGWVVLSPRMQTSKNSLSEWMQWLPFFSFRQHSIGIVSKRRAFFPITLRWPSK